MTPAIDPGLHILVENETSTGSELLQRFDQKLGALQHPLPEDNNIRDEHFDGLPSWDEIIKDVYRHLDLHMEDDNRIIDYPLAPLALEHPVPKNNTTLDEDFDGTLPDDESHSNPPVIPGLDTEEYNSTLDNTWAPAALEHPVPKDMTIADSGYDSGLPTCPKTICGQGSVDDDCASLVSDGWSSTLPSPDKHVLEGQFARGLFNSISARARQKLCTSSDIVTELLQCFAIMIGKQARSTTEKGAASFVRHGRR